MSDWSRHRARKSERPLERPRKGKENVARETREIREKKETKDLRQIHSAMLTAGQERLPGVATTEAHHSILFVSPFRVFSRVSRAAHLLFPLVSIRVFRGL
jgi:hypothetical protein